MPQAAPTLAALLGPLAVIAIFWLAALYVIKKYRGGFLKPPIGARERLKIIATKPIGWQTSLIIVEAEGQRFLLSASRGGLTPIGALNRPSSPQQTALMVPFPESAL